MGFRSFCPMKKRISFAVSSLSFHFGSVWGRGQLMLPWLVGVLTVTTTLCIWDMDWYRHTYCGFHGAVEASLALLGHGPWRTLCSNGLLSRDAQGDCVSPEHLPSLWLPHAPQFHRQLLSFSQSRAVLGGLVLSAESMPTISGIRDKVGQQFSRLLPSGNTVSFRVRGKQNKCGK